MQPLPTLTTLLSLSLTASSLAIPTPKIPPNESSCKATDHGLVISYTVRVGRPYSFEKCENVYGWMQDWGGVPSVMRCKKSDDGNFIFKFNNLRGQSKLINNALNHNWPVIARNGGFNCPDN